MHMIKEEKRTFHGLRCPLFDTVALENDELKYNTVSDYSAVSSCCGKICLYKSANPSVLILKE